MSEAVNEPRWRRLPEERPKQILDAALAVFAERGLAAARLEDIAKLAGVSKGTIYLYFANKEELFRGVVRSTVIELIDLPGDASPRQLRAARLPRSPGVLRDGGRRTSAAPRARDPRARDGDGGVP